MINQVFGIAADLVGRRLDEDIWILHDEREHLAEPGHADVAADYAQLGKLERNAIEMRDGQSPIGFPKRSGMSDLRAERNVELAARPHRVDSSAGHRAVAPIPTARHAAP